MRGIDLLKGVRGSAETDLNELAEVIFRITQVALTLDIEELEINPLRVAGNEIEALVAPSAGTTEQRIRNIRPLPGTEW